MDKRFRLVAVPPVDVAIAAGFVVLVLLESVFMETELPPLVHAAISVPAVALLAVRRRHPLAVATGVVAANLATNPSSQFSTLLALVLVAYTVGADARPPRHLVGLAILVAAMLGVSIRAGVEPSDVAAAVVFLVGPWMIGVGVRERDRRAHDAIERADRAESEQVAATAAAIAEERARIARELHDIVSHSISVIAIQSQAVRRRLAADQQAEKEDLAAIETTARQAMAEMRRLFGVLRRGEEGVALAPQPGLGELERLVDKIRGTGLAVDLRIRGARADLPPGVDLAAYRIVQEGLTNALRHARASRASVDLRFGREDLDIEVADDGVGEAATTGDGHGLVGIRERVALYGGTISAGAGDDGGFRLRARLPIRERV